MASKRPNGYWPNWSNVEAKLKELIVKLGHFPTARELCENGYSGMIKPLKYFHGGLIRVSKRLGFDGSEVPKGSWKSKGYTLNKARDLMKERGLDKLPSQRVLTEIGESSLSQAITKYHGGFHRFRKLLGEKKPKNEMNIWKEEEYALVQAKLMMGREELDHLPHCQRIRDLGYHSLSSAITKYHGGYMRFRRKLGEKQRQIKPGTLKDIAYILEKLKGVMNKHKCPLVPTSNELIAWGYGSLNKAIYAYHGGMSHIRRYFGESPKVKGNSWLSLEFALHKAESILDGNNLRELPTHRKLIKLPGGTSLSFAIMDYHGGYTTFRQELNKYLGREPENKQLENLLERYAGEQNV